MHDYATHVYKELLPTTQNYTYRDKEKSFMQNSIFYKVDECGHFLEKDPLFDSRKWPRSVSDF